MIEFKYLSAFLFGLMSSTHCLGMCGGISGAFGIATAQQSSLTRISRLFAYNSGRILCYGSAGFCVGILGQVATQQFASLVLPMRLLAALVLIAMACYIAQWGRGQWWMGVTAIETIGQRLWKHVQAFSLKIKPAHNLPSAFAFGFMWGLLPCGLVYSMLLWVGMGVNGSGGAVDGALLMLCFGLGTWPAMLALGYGSARLNAFLQARAIRQGSAMLLLLYGLWTLQAVLNPGH